MKTFGRADQSLQAKTQPGGGDVIFMNIIIIINARACAHARNIIVEAEGAAEFSRRSMGLAQMAVKGLAIPRCKPTEYWV